jgi:hypothetical protein
LAISFEKFSSLEDLIKIRGQIEVALRDNGDRFFYSPTWLIPFQKVLGKDREVDHIVGRDGNGSILGTMHLSVVETPYLKIFRPNVLALLGTRSVVSPEHLEFPIDQKNREEWCQFLERYIREKMSSCSFAVFDSVAEEASNLHACMDYLKAKGFRVVRNFQDECLYLDLPDSYEQLMTEFSANMRKIIRRTFRRTEGEIRLADYTELGGIEPALEEARRLHNLARSRKGDIGSFDRDGYMEFHRELAHDIADRGNLYLKFLMIDGKAAAFRYGFLDKGVYYDYQTGYDPELGDHRPGFLILAEVIRELIDRKIKRFDFLRGDESYKRHWANKKRNTYRYYIFFPGLKSWIYYALLSIYHGWR